MVEVVVAFAPVHVESAEEGWVFEEAEEAEEDGELEAEGGAERA